MEDEERSDTRILFTEPFEGPALASFDTETRPAKLSPDEGSDRPEDAVGREIRRERTMWKAIANPMVAK